MKTIIIILSLLTLNIALAAPLHKGSSEWFDQKFQVLLKSDAGNAEELDVEIGGMIKSHPTHFLKSLLKYESKIKRLDTLVGNYGEDFVDQPEKSKIESQKRIKSLEKAISHSKDKDFIRVGQRCIDELKR